MKWFKHHTDRSRDEWIAAYLDDCGPEHLQGYGFMIRLMELIAEQMSPDRPEPSLTLPLGVWSRQLHCHHHKVAKYLGRLGIAGGVTVEYAEGKVKVTCPELRELADDYFRKSGQGPKSGGKEENRRDEKRREREETAAAPPGAPLAQEFSLTEKRRDVAVRNCPTDLLAFFGPLHPWKMAPAGNGCDNVSLNSTGVSCPRLECGRTSL